MRVDDTTYTELRTRAAQRGRSVPAFLLEQARPAKPGGTGGWSLGAQRAVAEALDTIGTRLVRSGTLLNQYTARLHTYGRRDDGLDGLLRYHRETLARLTEVLAALDGGLR
ncbi:hypothetical protein GCM10009754_69940 [Amycolatopsis minnesotensis]|uniref:Mobilization protein n=1 Tax=Amycolatopsis minnesotensis TaxID=337894 RepID=A0ABN2S9S6_9PSEU